MVRKPAVRVRDVRSAFHHEDLGLLVQPAQARRTRRPARHSANDDDFHKGLAMSSASPAATSAARLARRSDYPIRCPAARSSVVSGSFDVVAFFHCSFEQLLRRLFEELRRGPLLHIEVVLDVAVAQHEVLPDLDGDQVLRRQVRHHVDVLDALGTYPRRPGRTSACRGSPPRRACARWPSVPP